MFVSCTLQVGELVACRGEMEAASGAAAAAAAGAEVQRRRGEAEAGSLRERVVEEKTDEDGEEVEEAVVVVVVSSESWRDWERWSGGVVREREGVEEGVRGRMGREGPRRCALIGWGVFRRRLRVYTTS